MIYAVQTNPRIDFRPSLLLAPNPVFHHPGWSREEPGVNSNGVAIELDPEDFADDGGWWYHCRLCDGHTRLRTKQPYCRHCGFSQTDNNQKEGQK